MASTLAEADNLNTQLSLDPSAESSREPENATTTTAPMEDELITTPPNDNKLSNNKLDADATSRFKSHEPFEGSIEPATTAANIDAPTQWGDEELGSFNAGNDVHSATRDVDSQNPSSKDASPLHNNKHDGQESNPRVSSNDSATGPFASSPRRIMTLSPEHHHGSRTDDPLVEVEPSSLKNLASSPPVVIVVPSPNVEEPDAMNQQKTSSAPELSSRYEESPKRRPPLQQFDSMVAEDGHSESEPVPKPDLTRNLPMEAVSANEKVNVDTPSESGYLAVQPINITSSSSGGESIPLAAESLTPRVGLKEIPQATEETSVDPEATLTAPAIERKESTEVLPPATPQQSIGTPSLEEEPTIPEEPVASTEEVLPLTPRPAFKDVLPTIETTEATPTDQVATFITGAVERAEDIDNSLPDTPQEILVIPPVKEKPSICEPPIVPVEEAQYLPPNADLTDISQATEKMEPISIDRTETLTAPAIERSESTDVLPPSTPQQDIETPSADQESPVAEEHVVSVEEAMRLTPRLESKEVPEVSVDQVGTPTAHETERAEMAERAESTDVLPPATPQQSFGTPVEEEPSAFEEHVVTVEEADRLTPRLDQENEEEMLKSRLAIGLDTPVEIEVSPELLVHSPSIVALPPDTPQVIEDFAEPEEEEPLVVNSIEESTGHTDTEDMISNEVSTAADTGHEASTAPDATIVTNEAEAVEPKENPTSAPIPIGELLITDAALKSLSPGSDWEEDVKTPLAAPRQIIDIEVQRETPQEESKPIEFKDVSHDETAKPNQARILQIQELVDKPAIGTSSGLERSASVVPIPPTSPHEEYDMSEAVETPTDVANKSTVSEENGDTTITQEIVVPTVTVIPSEPRSGDFVEDARSERSVGTSVAPIAPNSPRFISPYPTPSLDSTAFSSLEPPTQSTSAFVGTTSQPLTDSAVHSLPVAEDNVSELAPELKDALDTSFMHNYNHAASNAPATAPVGGYNQFGLPTVSENSNHISHEGEDTVSRPIRPRHTSTPSWTLNRSSGWFHSVPHAPGRPSLEIVEAEFSRPPSGNYPPPASARDGTHNHISKDDPRCVIM